METRRSGPLLPALNPAYATYTQGGAQSGVNACRIVLQLPEPGVPIPTLDGDIDCGFGYWSYLPMGYRFSSSGHEYQVTNRVSLPVSGGLVPESDFGGALDLHTCTRSGSTLTWTVEVAL